jgi:hypothetical protein
MTIIAAASIDRQCSSQRFEHVCRREIAEIAADHDDKGAGNLISCVGRPA